MAKLVAVLGSVTPPGRSLKAMELAIRCASEEAPGTEVQLLNLANYKITFADGRPAEQLGGDVLALPFVVPADDSAAVVEIRSDTYVFDAYLLDSIVD